MYSPIQLARKYLSYYFNASNGKGHGIHSPFVFDFIKFVLNDKKQYACYERVEAIRRTLLKDKREIEVADFGAGSALIKTNRRIVKQVAASSLKPRKFSQLLFRMAQYYQPDSILELGTSLGISTAYLATGQPNANVYTLEGAAAIAEIARHSFQDLSLSNVTLLEGEFEETLPLVFAAQRHIDFAFIDGNHREAPTLKYFRALLLHAAPTTILVFDDIHWSAGMEAAWATIQNDPAVTLTIDLFFIGIAFINPDFKVKQHFRIRF